MIQLDLRRVSPVAREWLRQQLADGAAVQGRLDPCGALLVAALERHGVVSVPLEDRTQLPGLMGATGSWRDLLASWGGRDDAPAGLEVAAEAVNDFLGQLADARDTLRAARRTDLKAPPRPPSEPGDDVWTPEPSAEIS
jgi:hypothetical protein